MSFHDFLADGKQVKTTTQEVRYNRRFYAWILMKL